MFGKSVIGGTWVDLAINYAQGGIFVLNASMTVGKLAPIWTGTARAPAPSS